MFEPITASLAELHAIIGGRLRAALDPETSPAHIPVGPISTDTRTLQEGDIFWALDGPNFSGRDFTQVAYDRGALGAVVPGRVEVPRGRWAIGVDDSHAALRALAAWNRNRFGGTVIAVTGSMGKSTTREMLHRALAGRLEGTASPKNYNNHLGVPLSLMAIRPRHDYAVLELGASAEGEIATLAALCEPNVGIITNIGDAHLGGFGSRQGIARAKGELLEALPASGHAVLGDDPWLRHLAREADVPVTLVGVHSDCDVIAQDVSFERGRLRFTACGQAFEIPVWGRHHLTSALAAIAVARLLGIPPRETADALADFEPLRMRCEVFELRGATIINDCYSANPSAMRAAFDLLGTFDTHGKRIAVLGEMAELGDEAARLHREIGEDAVTLGRADLVIACGAFASEMIAGASAAGLHPSRAIAMTTLQQCGPFIGQTLVPGDVLLVKGSRSVQMEQVLDEIAGFPRRRSA